MSKWHEDEDLASAFIAFILFIAAGWTAYTTANIVKTLGAALLGIIAACILWVALAITHETFYNLKEKMSK